MAATSRPTCSPMPGRSAHGRDLTPAVPAGDARSRSAAELPNDLYLRFIRARGTAGSGRGGATAVLRPSWSRGNARLQSLSSQRQSRRWSYWLPEQRQRLPEAWPEAGTRKRTANGDEIELRARLVDLDPVEQRQTLEMRAELWREGRLVAQEDRLLQENLYFRNEILLMLANAGFADVSVRAGYSVRKPTADDTMLVFIAPEVGKRSQSTCRTFVIHGPRACRPGLRPRARRARAGLTLGSRAPTPG